jgi:hypothetical protein
MRLHNVTLTIRLLLYGKQTVGHFIQVKTICMDKKFRGQSVVDLRGLGDFGREMLIDSLYSKLLTHWSCTLLL